VIQENEVVTLLLSIGVLVFVLLNRSQLGSLPLHRLIVGAFLALIAGQVLTILEGLRFGEVLNLAEHVCYAVSALLLAVWAWRALGRGTEP